MTNDSGNPPPGGVASAPLLHLDELVRAYEGATDEGDRRMFLRGCLRALEHVTGRTHAALEALTRAMSKEGK
jgi:hypothetical protein